MPAPLELEVLADSAPRVEITAPAGDTVLAPAERVGLGLTASDDHGIASLTLRIARLGAAGDQPGTGQPVASSVGTSWVGVASVDVAALQAASRATRCACAPKWWMRRRGGSAA